MRAELLIAIAENDDAREPNTKNVLAETFAQHRLKAEIEVYAGAMHGWCVLDSRVYNQAPAESLRLGLWHYSNARYNVKVRRSRKMMDAFDYSAHRNFNIWLFAGIGRSSTKSNPASLPARTPIQNRARRCFDHEPLTIGRNQR